MAILSRPRLLPAQRFNLEDLEALLSAARTDSKLYTKQFLSAQNYILKGFVVTGLGLKVATVAMADATLIFPENTNDFSYFISAPDESNITISDSELVDNIRNYIELKLETENNTPLTAAFWDQSANSGAGQEFNQIVDTVTDLKVTIVVRSGGFSGSADRVPLAILDTASDGTIKSIFDQRNLFYRQGTAADPSSGFTWSSTEEPVFTIVITAPTGTYVAGETVTFSGGATATVVTGGTTTITVRLPSDLNMFPGNTIVGGTSASSGTVNTISESFTGADKDLGDAKENDLAVKEELRTVKGTPFWYSQPGNSLRGLSEAINSSIVQISATGKFIWTGTELKITDDDGTPADADILGKIRVFGSSQQFTLTRQDGTGGSVSIPILDGQVLFIAFPTSGDRTYSDVGSGDTNYQVAYMEDFIISDSNYWLAYREGGRLAVRDQSDLSTDESAPIGDSIPGTLLANLGLADEIAPAVYPSTTFISQSSPLVTAIGALDTRAVAQRAAANQNQTLRLIGGGSWTYDNGTGTLAWDAAANIAIPGLADSANLIAVGDVSLLDGDVVYVSVNRSGVGGTIVPTVIDEASYVQSENSVLLARRVGSLVHVGTNATTMTLANGESRPLGQDKWMAPFTVKGNNTGSLAEAEDITVADALSMLMSTQGDMIYGGASGLGTRLPGDTSDIKKFLTTTSIAGIAQPPEWSAVTTTTTVVSKTANYAVDVNDDVILVSNAVNNSVIITLPSAVGLDGKMYVIKKTTFTSFLENVAINAAGGQFIDGVATRNLSTLNDTIKIVSDGTNWIVLERRIPSEWINIALGYSGGISGVASQDTRVRREGDSLHVKLVFTNISAGAAVGRIVLPTGLNLDTNKVSNLRTMVGTYHRQTNNGTYQAIATANGNSGAVVANTGLTTSVYLSFKAINTANPYYAEFTMNSFIVSGDGISADFLIPISGWES